MSSRRKTILVTGASTGIGRDISIALARRGYTVFAGVRNTQAAEELERAGESATGVLSSVRLDVTDDSSVARAIEKISEEAAGLDGLVNNAGIAVAGPLETVTNEDFAKQFEVNVFGVHRVTRASLPLLRKVTGRIVNISSVSGRISTPIMGPYCASKFALEAYSDALRREVEPQGIRVSVVEPGPIKTPIWEKSLKDAQSTLDALTSEQASLYGDLIRKIQEVANDAQKKAPPPEVVVKLVLHALESDAPKIRYPVGPSVKFASFLANVVPDPLLDRIMRQQMRLLRR